MVKIPSSGSNENFNVPNMLLKSVLGYKHYL